MNNRWLLAERGLKVQVVITVPEAVVQDPILLCKWVALGHWVVPRVSYRAHPAVSLM